MRSQRTLVWRGIPGSVCVRSAQGTIDRVWLIPRRTPLAGRSLETREPGLPTGSERTASGQWVAVASAFAAYLSGEATAPDVRWRLNLSAGFQRDVLEALSSVPYGETVSYGELAAMAGRPRAARAVGNALNRNPLPILVPCHRVVTADGGVGGFGAGPAWKHYLHGIEMIELAV